MFSIFDKNYDECSKEIETKIKDTGSYKYTKSDKCFKEISSGLFVNKYEHRFVMDHNDFKKGKIKEYKTQEYIKCKEKMKEEIEKKGNKIYYKNSECHNELKNYQSKKYNVTYIHDKTYDFKNNMELVMHHYIGFTVSKK
jgi:hypothetical protein